MRTIEQRPVIFETPVVKRMASELGWSDFDKALIKIAGFLLVGSVLIAAPFIIHAAVTKKPGTIWEE